MNLLTRASLLSLAKSIYYMYMYVIMSGGRFLEAESKRICRISVKKIMIAVVKKLK